MLSPISDPESLTPVSSSASSSSSDASSGASTAASADETTSSLEVLGDCRRRAVLEYLADDEGDDPVPLSDLADHVALVEEGEERGALAGCGDALLGTRRRVHISLRHRHVPKLAAADAVAFDPEANAVTLTETGTELLARAAAIDRATAGSTPETQ